MLTLVLILGSMSMPFAALTPQQSVATTLANRNNEAWWAQRHEACVALTKQGGFDVAFLGDSITQGWEGGGKAVWDRLFAPMKAANFGFSGDRTEHVLWRLANGELIGAKPKVIVIMIGTNNIGHGSSNAAQTAEGVRAIVSTLRKQLPQTKILLNAIFPRGKDATDPMRVAVAEATRQFQSVADGKNVVFMDLAPRFLQPDGSLPTDLMPDSLHPNALGYEIWGTVIAPTVDDLVNGRPMPDQLKFGSWQSLFDGKSLKGWIVRGGKAAYKAENGTIVGTTVTGSPNTFLCTEKDYGDFELEFDVKDDDRLNSGVQIRTKTPLTGDQHPHGPQVEIEASPGQSGYIYGEATQYGWLSPEPNNPSKFINEHSFFKNGEWNHYRVIAIGPRIRTWLNGIPVADLTHEEIYKTHSTGVIGLQVHAIGQNEGPYSVAWKNIRIRMAR